MIVLLSPAKALDESDTSLAAATPATTPRLVRGVERLLPLLKAMPTAKLKAAMSLSDSLAALNRERFQTFHKQRSKQCVLAFDGPAFKALAAPLMSVEQLRATDSRLRVLSGMYGLLRPLDAVKPYRLEMGMSLANEAGKDLYAFWGEEITELLAADVQAQPAQEGRFVVNLASQEYFKAVRSQLLYERGIPVYTMLFPGPAVYAKMGRGAAARFLIETKASCLDDLKKFTGADGEWKFVGEKVGRDGLEVSLTFQRLSSEGGASAKKKTPTPTNKAKVKGEKATPKQGVKRTEISKAGPRKAAKREPGHGVRRSLRRNA
mmetsp:Transcript_13295/g.48401  ORF Transcript_13295/g.48401 Transcript_13295/m.48401 type:complete len:320 (-) Transcript_13295:1609-2568(-)